MVQLIGAIEAGGTKFRCAVGDSPQDIKSEIIIPTTTPEETLLQVVDFFKKQSVDTDISAIGIGSFGPVDLNEESSTYGFITNTPKVGWSQTDIVGILKKEFNIPISFDTDVNAAALGEYYYGAGQNLDDFVYLTVGTGIGGGAIVNGKLTKGLLHPEMGHVLLPMHYNDITKGFQSVCPFHDNCLEGLASGVAIESRYGEKAQALAENHPAWELVAHYLALGIMNFICTLSPKRIILGGGVMQNEQLYPLIRNSVRELLNGYIQVPEILTKIDDYIVPPMLGKDSGIVGAMSLTKQL